MSKFGKFFGKTFVRLLTVFAVAWSVLLGFQYGTASKKGVLILKKQQSQSQPPFRVRKQPQSRPKPKTKPGAHLPAISIFNYSTVPLLTFDAFTLHQNVLLYLTRSSKLLNSIVSSLLAYADDELSNTAVYSVTDKRVVPPSGSKHDYMSVSPYQWPNPDTKDGFPYLLRDGIRRPEATLYSEESDDYDRTRVANFFRNVTVLTLAGVFSQNVHFLRKSARYISRWFLMNDTKMNPNLYYAQRVPTPNNDNTIGNISGVLDLVRLPVVLDMFQVLHATGYLSDVYKQKMSLWLSEYANFLTNSSQGVYERGRKNNRGTLYEYHLLGVLGFLEDRKGIREGCLRVQGRMQEQIAENGSLPLEHARAKSLHYALYGLQAFVEVCNMCERLGEDVWQFTSPNMSSPDMRRAMEYVVPYFRRKKTSYEEADEEEMHRMLFLYFNAIRKFNLTVHRSATTGKGVVKIPNSLFEAKALFSDYAMISPFWVLGFPRYQ